MTSLWLTTVNTPARLPLTPGSRFDTVVIGAGITGLVTALLLAESGVEVAVVEAKRVGEATTGASTGKISLLQGTRAQRIRRRHGDSALTDYVDANREAQQWLLRYCAERSVPFQRVPALTYAQSPAEMTAVSAELAATRAAGLPVVPITASEAPFPIHGAVRLEDQAQLDPVALLSDLALAVEAHTVPIFESTPVRDVRDGDKDELVIETANGDLIAHRVIIATGTPILDRGGFFARLSARRSYLTAFSVTDPIPREMFLSAGRPTRSLRYAPSPEGDLLLVGGNGHTVGRTTSAKAHADDVIEWTQKWFPTAEPLQSWSAQDYTPIDELPYVGPLVPGRDRILVATGYAKWGLTNGVAAALATVGRLTGKPPTWSGTFASWRISELKSLRASVVSNSAVAQELLSGWRDAVGSGPGAIPAEGCGRVERHGLRPTAVSTVDGVTTEVSAICPHLRGIVRWNDAERSWDCPLHGSRFAHDGTLLEGPATTSLEQLAVHPAPNQFPIGPQ